MELDTGLLLIRIVVGLLFVGHGTRKLFGWFRGDGIAGTGKYFESLGYSKGRTMAVLAGMAETGGGLSLLFGFLTPLGAIAIVAVMVNAILAAHWDAGLWSAEGGYEYPLTLAVLAIAFAIMGPGAVSVDAAMGAALYGPLWGAIAVLGGGVASFAAIGTRGASHVEA